MNKHTVIVSLGILVIVFAFAYSGWNIYAVEQLQFSVADKEESNYFDIVNGAEVSVCNPLPFYVNFNEFNMIMVFEGKDKGIFSIQSTTLPPQSSSEIEGNFHSETFEEVQYLALHYDGMFGESTPVRIDPRKLVVVTEIETPIIGVVPYTVTKQYSGVGFWNAMNDDSKFSC